MSQDQHNMKEVDRRRFLSSLGLSAGAIAYLAQVQAAQAAAAPPAAPVAAAAAPAGAPARVPMFMEQQLPQLTQLAGKTAYITGGNTGIGLGVARAAANAGMNVVMGYIQEDKVDAALKLFKPNQLSRVVAMRHDVTDRPGWVKLLADINAKFGNLHLLVNNAGIKTLSLASQVDAARWDAAVNVNFTGIYNGGAVCVPHMLGHKEGSHIVTTSSMGGLLPGVNAGVYTATKFAAVGMMEALRVELAGTNIGTSAYCPGGVSTDNFASTEGASSLMMDPLEAGERVLHGVKNNDLFILTHPEFAPGMKERFDAILASAPQESLNEARAKAQTRVLTSPAYAFEVKHRSKKRENYRS